MAIPLLICADDFGYSAAVDEGIAVLVEQGRVTATSCLTMSPRWRAAVPTAREIRRRADLGLHLDLTEFSREAPLPRLLFAGRLGLLSRDAVKQRIVAQLDRFEDDVGAAPDYVDGHQHVHQLPSVARLLLDELARRYANAIPWIRLSLPAGRQLKERLIAATGAAALRRRLDVGGIRHNARLLGVYGFDASPPWLERAATWLGAARAGDALMVHPATGATPGDPLGDARQREFEGLRSEPFADLLAKHGLVPSRGDSLAAGSIA